MTRAPSHLLCQILQSQEQIQRENCGNQMSHWESWIDGVTNKMLWDIHNFVKKPGTDGSKSRFLALLEKRDGGSILTSTTNKDKSQLLMKYFCPSILPEYPPPTAEAYPPARFPFKQNTKKEIETSIEELSTQNAPC